MALAVLADVRRYLRGVTAEDAELTPLLEAVEEWVEESYNRDWDASGSVTETFYHVDQGGFVRLKDANPSGVSVVTYLSPDATGSTLSAEQFMVQGGGKVWVRRTLTHMPESLRPEERETELSWPLRYAKVAVTYTASNTVPKPVREAVAMITAASFAQAGHDVSGLKSERLGDYSYVRAGDRELVIPARASEYLSAFSGNRRVVTT